MMLIIGYGNPLRSDDAVGQQVAQALAQRLDASLVQVQTAYQLTPELVAPVAGARAVVFIDACVGESPGSVACEKVAPQVGGGIFTHHVSPAALLSAARDLYGADPAGLLISITGAAFDYGSVLSPELNRLLPGIIDQAEAIINAHCNLSCEEKNRHA